jgi:AraC family transcriptional regulator
MGWKGIQAVRWRTTPESGELNLPPSSVHAIILLIRPPEKLGLRCQGVQIEGPVPASSVLVFPAGSSKFLQWEGSMDSLGIYMDPGLIARVAAESFDFDPTPKFLRPLHRLTVPELRAAMLAVDAELRIGGPGSPLLIESLGTMLCVHLLRHVISPHRLRSAGDGILSRRKLHNVIDYIMQNLEGSPSLGQMAATAHLSPYHFARQFKAATGLPPYQYVIARRVERALHLLRGHNELGLAEVALRAGFSDQSKLSFHFKRLLGVTPRQFWLSGDTRLTEKH